MSASYEFSCKLGPVLKTSGESQRKHEIEVRIDADSDVEAAAQLAAVIAEHLPEDVRDALGVRLDDRGAFE